MDDATIAAIVAEITPLLIGRAPGKVFQLGPQSLAIDFGLRGEGYLFISAAPDLPRLYLIKRRVRELEKQSVTPGNFGLSLRKELSSTSLREIQKELEDRVVRFNFEGSDELGQPKQRSMIAQLTGRSANLLLLNKSNQILAQLREGQGLGQTIGDTYHPPKAQPGVRNRRSRKLDDVKSVSEFLDDYYARLINQQVFESQISAARSALRKDLSRRQKLVKQLEADLAAHGDAEENKRIGDLLLANVSTAKRKGDRVQLIDYFAEGTPEIEVEIDKQLSITEAAARRFDLYARSKRARNQIASRIREVRPELAGLEAQLESLASRTAESTTTRPLVSSRAAATKQSSRPRANRIPGTRRYTSSDDYEILVGRAARDNDHLTFKVAKPNDLWLHAADYAGSHVVVRNPTRKQIPHRTLIEAAQLAAHFSQAKKDQKVDVHYTERKFLSKPKGAAPGLVRLSRFKNITVAPAEVGNRVT